jgi:hypothetical protein
VGESLPREDDVISLNRDAGQVQSDVNVSADVVALFLVIVKVITSSARQIEISHSRGWTFAQMAPTTERLFLCGALIVNYDPR